MESNKLAATLNQGHDSSEFIAGLPRKVWKLAGSRQLALGILIVGATYAFLLTAWGAAGSTSERLSGISGLFSFKVLFAMFFINQIVCWIDFLPVTLRRLRYPDINALDRYPYQAELPLKEDTVDQLQEALSAQGFKVRSINKADQSAKGIVALKGRLSPLGNTIFHISFFLLLIGVWISAQGRFQGYIRAYEGQSISGLPQEYLSYFPVEDFTGRAPNLSFKLEKVSADFWKNQLLFTDLRGKVKFPLENLENEDEVRLSKSFVQDQAYMVLTGYGFAPTYRLEGEVGVLIEETRSMGLFPPGNEEILTFQGLPHKAIVSFYPDFELKRGRGTSKSMNLKNPRFWVSIMRGKLVVAQGFIKPGETLRFEAYKLTFPEVKRYGDFRVIKDPGYTWLIIAFWVAVIGLALRLLVPRREVSAKINADDTSGKHSIKVAGKAEWFGGLWEKEWNQIIESVKRGPVAGGQGSGVSSSSEDDT